MDSTIDRQYRGRAQWIKLISSNICFAPMPNADDEVEQHLRINSDGRVWLSRYAYGAGGKHKCFSKRQYHVGADVVIRILTMIDDAFSDYSPNLLTDVGSWSIAIANEFGEEYYYNGPLIGNTGTPQAEVSERIRDMLNMPWLLLFDGNAVLDQIERLCIEYHRCTVIKTKALAEYDTDHVTWDYTEKLVLDRASETLEHTQNIGSGCVVNRKYYVQGGMESLLDDIDADFFDYIQGEPADAYINPKDQNDYRITVDYQRAPQRILIGSYAKDTLPIDWPELMEDIYSFMRFYGMGEILDSDIYTKGIRRIGDKIFLHVAFDDYGKTYCYRTDDDSIVVGDYVLAPVGHANRPTKVKVKSIDYLPEDKAPIPYEKIKHIIRKCVDDDFVENEEAETNHNGEIAILSDAWLNARYTAGTRISIVDKLVYYKYWYAKEGRTIGVSVDFEYADDVHYYLAIADWALFVSSIPHDDCSEDEALRRFFVSNNAMGFEAYLDDAGIKYSKIAFY